MLTQEQVCIANTVKTTLARQEGRTPCNIYVHAVAGAGKSSTLLHIILSVPHATVYLISFNVEVSRTMEKKLLAAMAATQLPTHISICTVNSLALKLCKQYCNGCASIDDNHLYSTLYRLAPTLSKTELIKQYQIVLRKRQNGIFPTNDYGPLTLCDTVLSATLQPDCTVFDQDGTIYFAVFHCLTLSTTPDLLLIDEGQDFSTLNAAFLKHCIVSEKTHTCIVIVGDHSQSIYGFRGASKSALEKLAYEWCMQQYPLTYCFRCPQKVIAVTQNINGKIRGGTTNDTKAVQVAIVRNQDSYILNTIKGNQKTTAAPCILSRNNRPIVKMLYHFFLHNQTNDGHCCCAWIAPTINGALRYTRQMCINRSGRTDSIQFDNLLTRRDILPPSATVQLLFHMGFRHDMPPNTDIDCDRWLDFVEDVLQCGETGNRTQPDVIFCTVHAAKGLEFPCVYLCQYNLFGYRSDEGSTQDVNLLYIALTRCQQKLILIIETQYLHIQSPYLPLETIMEHVQ